MKCWRIMAYCCAINQGSNYGLSALNHTMLHALAPLLQVVDEFRHLFLIWALGYSCKKFGFHFQCGIPTQLPFQDILSFELKKDFRSFPDRIVHEVHVELHAGSQAGLSLRSPFAAQNVSIKRKGASCTSIWIRVSSVLMAPGTRKYTELQGTVQNCSRCVTSATLHPWPSHTRSP